MQPQLPQGVNVPCSRIQDGTLLGSNPGPLVSESDSLPTKKKQKKKKTNTKRQSDRTNSRAALERPVKKFLEG